MKRTCYFACKNFYRPDSSTTIQGDENNNNSSATRFNLTSPPPPPLPPPLPPPKISNRSSPSSDIDSSSSSSSTSSLSSSTFANAQIKKLNSPIKYSKKRSLLQEVPAKYFSAKKAIMLNFLNAKDEKNKLKSDDENSYVENFDKRDNNNQILKTTAADNQTRMKRGNEDSENNYKNQYSVLQVRTTVYTHFNPPLSSSLPLPPLPFQPLRLPH